MSRRTQATVSLGGTLLAQVALTMADGQIHQADLLLCDGPKPKGERRSRLEVALLHMRSACKWLESCAMEYAAYPEAS